VTQKPFRCKYGNGASTGLPRPVQWTGLQTLWPRWRQPRRNRDPCIDHGVADHPLVRVTACRNETAVRGAAISRLLSGNNYLPSSWPSHTQQFDLQTAWQRHFGIRRISLRRSRQLPVIPADHVGCRTDSHCRGWVDAPQPGHHHTQPRSDPGFAPGSCLWAADRSAGLWIPAPVFASISGAADPRTADPRAADLRRPADS
jgi:hypothetical protein